MSFSDTVSALYTQLGHRETVKELLKCETYFSLSIGSHRSRKSITISDAKLCKRLLRARLKVINAEIKGLKADLIA